MCVAFEIFVEHFEGLRRERSAPFALFRRFAADKVGQVLHAVLVALLGLGHPPLEDRLDLLGALRRDVELLKPAVTNGRRQLHDH